MSSTTPPPEAASAPPGVGRGSAPPGSAPTASDPPGARLAFYIFGDTSACVRFLAVIVVAVASLVVLALVAPALAKVIASIAATVLGGRAAMRWWRSRHQEPNDPSQT